MIKGMVKLVGLACIWYAFLFFVLNACFPWKPYWGELFQFLKIFLTKSEDSRYLKLYKLNNLTQAVCILLTKWHHMKVYTLSITDSRT